MCYVDLSRLSERSMPLKDKRLTIRIPPLMIERPNVDTVRVRIFDAGAWSDIINADKRLEKATRGMAAKQLDLQANSPFLMKLATKQATLAVYNNARAILNAAGGRDTSLTVTF